MPIRQIEQTSSRHRHFDFLWWRPTRKKNDETTTFTIIYGRLHS